MIIDELQNGIDGFKKLQHIITNNDIKIISVDVARELLNFISKVENRVSNHKRIDLYCYDKNIPNILYEPSKAQEKWVVVGLFEKGIGQREYKRSHTYRIPMLQDYYVDSANQVIDTLNNPKYAWIYDGIKDESTRETLGKFMVFMKKYHSLLMNIENSEIDLKLMREVELPLKILRTNSYEEKCEVNPITLTRIKFDTTDIGKIQIEANSELGYDENAIELNNYKKYYLLQQHYETFKESLVQFKQQIKEAIAELYIRHKELKSDTDTLKSELGHIFVADAI